LIETLVLVGKPIWLILRNDRVNGYDHMEQEHAAKGHWKQALNALAMRNRVHVCADMSEAYRELAKIYNHCELMGFGSGEKCGTWVVPPAWEVDKAVLTGPDGQVIADWAKRKLHLFTYSPPFQGTLTLEELQDHLFSIPSKPDRVPFHFRNQYRHWQPEWGFCLPTTSARASLRETTKSIF
jgi:aminopeptidase-like protein